MGINLALLQQARQSVYQMQKSAFVAAGDPALGGDPAAAAGGGAPPMDPMAAGGAASPMDPMAAGGAPPMDPAAAGGAPPMDPMAAIGPMIQQAVQQAMASGGGPQGAGPGIKPKIDVNVEIMQMKKMLAKVMDAMGIHMPIADMVATPDDLNQIAQGGAGYAAATPDGGQSGGAMGAIPPIEPMKAAEAWESGVAFTPPSEFSLQQSHAVTQSTANLAAALLMRRRA